MAMAGRQASIHGYLGLVRTSDSIAGIKANLATITDELGLDSFAYYVFRPRRRRSCPIAWSAVRANTRLSKRQRILFDEATACGLAHGKSVPLHEPAGGLALPSFASDAPERDFDEIRRTRRDALVLVGADTQEAMPRTAARELRPPGGLSASAIACPRPPGGGSAVAPTRSRSFAHTEERDAIIWKIQEIQTLDGNYHRSKRA